MESTERRIDVFASVRRSLEEEWRPADASDQVRVGLPNGDYLKMARIAKRAEELGYFAVALEDHFFRRDAGAQPTDPQLDCYTTLSALAAATKTVRLSPLVAGCSYRNPALLAKMIATLDNITGANSSPARSGLVQGGIRHFFLNFLDEASLQRFATDVLPSFQA